ncbi:MAG: peptide chain release factor 1 [bacterium]
MPNIEDVRQEYENILNQLTNPELISDWERFEELSKKKSALEKIVDKGKEVDELKARIEENHSIIALNDDPELVSLANMEIAQIQEKLSKTEQELKGLLAGDNPNQERQSVILEIRAGTGGDEAALFVADLYKMYTNFAKISKWGVRILDSNPCEIGGYKEIVFELTPGTASIDHANLWNLLKYEGGVHRVQRIPETEKAGRIHTSTASVAVLKKPSPTEMRFRPDDLRIDFFRSSGPGGQNVNKRETAVRITHLPTGVVVASQRERSQLDNRETAMGILMARVLEKQEENARNSMGSDRNSQIGTAQRAEKIRTYNYPQDRLTDHRIKKSWHHLENILEGDIEPIITALSQLEVE